MNLKKFNKKCMFLSLIALLIVMLFAFVLTIQNISISRNEIEVVKTRVTTVDDLMKYLLDVYIPKVAEVSVYNSLDYIATHSYDGSVSYESNFLQLMKAGKLLENDDIILSLANKNWNYLINEVQALSKEHFMLEEIKIQIVPNSLKLTQQDPWHINITLKVNVEVDAGLAKWENEDRLIKTQLDITGLRDKMVVDKKVKAYIATFPADAPPSANLIEGHVNNIKGIKYKVGTESTDDYIWIEQSDDDSIIQLKEYVNKDFYFYYSNSSSYLQRIQGMNNEQSSCCGITAFSKPIDVTKDTYSSLDYCKYGKKKDVKSGCGPALLYCNSFIVSSQQARYFNIEGKCGSTRPTT